MSKRLLSVIISTLVLSASVLAMDSGKAKTCHNEISDVLIKLKTWYENKETRGAKTNQDLFQPFEEKLKKYNEMEKWSSAESNDVDKILGEMLEHVNNYMRYIQTEQEKAKPNTREIIMGGAKEWGELQMSIRHAQETCKK